MNDFVQIPDIIRVLVPGLPGPPGPPGPSGTPNIRGPYPFGNIAMSEDGLLFADTSLGQQNIAIGNNALEKTVSGDATVAIGDGAGQWFGQQIILPIDNTFAGWTIGAGWSVAAGKATHTAGSTAALSRPTPSIVDNVPYYVKFSVSGRTTGSLTIQFDGGGTPSVSGTHPASNGDFVMPLRPNAGNIQLSLIPTSDFNGSVFDALIEGLGGRTSVFVGHVAGQYARNGASNTFVGGYAGQGQEMDPVTGGDMSGTHPLDGGNNQAFGEACMLHLIGGGGGNSAYGFGTMFNTTTGSGNCAFGNGACQALTTQSNNCAFGYNAYQYGTGETNLCLGYLNTTGAAPFTNLSANILEGDGLVAGRDIHVADASIFPVGAMVVNNSIFGPNTRVTSVDLPNNTFRVDKCAFNAADAGAFVWGVANPHTGTEVVSAGYLTLQNLSGAATQVTAIGARAGRALTTGSNNTFVGYRAGDTLTTGISNIALGRAVNLSSPTASNEMNLGGAVFATGIGTTPVLVGIVTNAPTAKLDVNGDTIRLRTAKTPASATAAGNPGDHCWDANFFYVCVATNTWKRAALATW
jgi:hypothetical protein